MDIPNIKHHTPSAISYVCVHMFVKQLATRLSDELSFYAFLLSEDWIFGTRLAILEMDWQMMSTNLSAELLGRLEHLYDYDVGLECMATATSFLFTFLFLIFSTQWFPLHIGAAGRRIDFLGFGNVMWKCSQKGRRAEGSFNVVLWAFTCTSGKWQDLGLGWLRQAEYPGV